MYSNIHVCMYVVSRLLLPVLLNRIFQIVNEIRFYRILNDFSVKFGNNIQLYNLKNRATTVIRMLTTIQYTIIQIDSSI